MPTILEYIKSLRIQVLVEDYHLATVEGYDLTTVEDYYLIINRILLYC
jgi:hypothetical protein